MMWDITADRGFLGENDPLKSLVPQKGYPLADGLEKIVASIPVWIEQRQVREELVSQLREVYKIFLPTTYVRTKPHIDNNIFASQIKVDEQNHERLMHLYSYMASAYVYARHELPASRIPQEIAMPLVLFANQLDRKPILSYASYCLTNWERKTEGPIQLDNIKLMSNFCAPEVGKRDEDWFILVHVEIEAGAAPGVFACQQLLQGELDPKAILSDIHRSLLAMNQTLARMPEQCSPDNYFRWVRPYIFSFKDVVYEGCFDNQPQTFRGETGAQSTVIPIFLAALGIKHKDSMLTQHLEEMRMYMPRPHRDFLQNLLIHQADASVSLRSKASQDAALKDVYNECVAQIIQFRAKHFEFAVNYIYNKVESPEGTGGTPYIPWLKQLKEETEEQLL